MRAVQDRSGALKSSARVPVLFCGARAMVLNVRSDSARCAATTFHLLRSALAMLLLMVHYSMLWTAATTYDDARRASVHGTMLVPVLVPYSTM